MYDVIIIGAGVTGCAVARYLSRYQGSALVLERAEDVCCGTSKANSAIIHAGFDAAHGSLMAKMNVQGNRMLPELAKELDFPFRRNSSLVVCMSEEDMPRLRALYENGVKNGVEGLEIVDAQRLGLTAEIAEYEEDYVITCLVRGFVIGSVGTGR